MRDGEGRKKGLEASNLRSYKQQSKCIYTYYSIQSILNYANHVIRVGADLDGLNDLPEGQFGGESEAMVDDGLAHSCHIQTTYAHVGGAKRLRLT